jgi:hypothetical protein
MQAQTDKAATTQRDEKETEKVARQNIIGKPFMYNSIELPAMQCAHQGN